MTLLTQEEEVSNVFAQEEVVEIEEEQDLLDFMLEKFKEVKEDYEGVERKLQ